MVLLNNQSHLISFGLKFFPEVSDDKMSLIKVIYEGTLEFFFLDVYKL